MNGKLLISLLAGLLLAGGTGVVWADDVVCAPIDVKDKECRGDKDYPIVTINTNTKKIAPEFICAARDSVIEFRVVPPGRNYVGTVAVKAKKETNTWLNGRNSPDERKIKILVPDWVVVETDHYYNVVFGDGTCIDPRVHVE